MENNHRKLEKILAGILSELKKISKVLDKKKKKNIEN